MNRILKAIKSIDWKEVGDELLVAAFSVPMWYGYIIVAIMFVYAPERIFDAAYVDTIHAQRWPLILQLAVISVGVSVFAKFFTELTFCIRTKVVSRLQQIWEWNG